MAIEVMGRMIVLYTSSDGNTKDKVGDHQMVMSSILLS
jgi:hypothetical protein